MKSRLLSWGLIALVLTGLGLTMSTPALAEGCQCNPCKCQAPCPCGH